MGALRTWAPTNELDERTEGRERMIGATKAIVCLRQMYMDAGGGKRWFQSVGSRESIVKAVSGKAEVYRRKESRGNWKRIAGVSLYSSEDVLAISERMVMRRQTCARSRSDIFHYPLNSQHLAIIYKFSLNLKKI